MTAYIIGQMEIHSRDWMEEYFAKIPDVVRRHKGAFKVRGGQPERLKRTGKMPDAAFVIEFPGTRSFCLPFYRACGPVV